ncbi:hypothetical protein FE257_004455 [Aspergillus nanangensis]|uniref:EthD domain-containing protein n=1 Tax=Aspergillus nanangensis TaxID=2582783 RepID=A0AAD4CY45_ASPNN|nr:hypothetical protein FE257_004455 [Aspergillus nanangensis]
MPITITILYAAEPDLKFDLDHFMDHHVPRVLKEFGPFGLKAFRVVQLRGSPFQPGTSQDFMFQIQQDWDTLADFQRGSEAVGEELGKHVATFSNKYPLVMYGDILKEHHL